MDEANRILLVDVDSDEKDFQEAEIIFAQENDSSVDASGDFFFEIPNDNQNIEGGISTVLSAPAVLLLLCCCFFLGLTEHRQQCW